LQVIYAHELKGSELDDTCEFMLDEGNPPIENIVKYGKQLSNLIFQHTIEVDKLIRSRSKNWDFDRITIIDKLILRMALVEMIYVDAVPPKVSIAEGVEIAKQFSTEDSSSFINGILDAIYNGMVKKKENSV
jgi:N utilization substance protein B